MVDSNNYALRVQQKAYEIYERRGRVDGHDWDDWLEALREVEAETNMVDRDCIRSETFYESSHQFKPLPASIDPQGIKNNK